MLKKLVATKELNLKGSFRFHSEFELAVNMMKKKLINVNPLITHKLDFKSAKEAFELAMNNDKKSMKVQLSFLNEFEVDSYNLINA